VASLAEYKPGAVIKIVEMPDLPGLPGPHTGKISDLVRKTDTRVPEKKEFPAKMEI